MSIRKPGALPFPGSRLRMPMSDYLRLTYNLLVNLRGVSSPELFPVESIVDNPGSNSKTLEPKPGNKKFEPEEFSFFQGSICECYLLGHIPRTGETALPVLYSIIASGVLLRTNGEMRPYFEPMIREVVLLPEELNDSEEIIEEHLEAGLDIERYTKGDNTYSGLRKNAASKVMDILADLKKQVYLTFNETEDAQDFLVLIDGSLAPTDDILKCGNWVGIHSNPKLSPHEEKVCLGLEENQIGPPFSISNDDNGYFWHLRMFHDYRKDPSWGLVKLENALSNGDDMPSKIEAVSSGVLTEKFPIHPRAKQEGDRLYPLTTARVFLRTQVTDGRSILKYF